MVELTPEIMSWVVGALVGGMFLGAALGLLGGWIGARNVFKNRLPEYDMESLNIAMQPIPVRAAKLCIDCDVLFNTTLTACPICTGGAWAWLSNWIQPPVFDPSDGDLELMYPGIQEGGD